MHDMPIDRRNRRNDGPLSKEDSYTCMLPVVMLRPTLPGLDHSWAFYNYHVIFTSCLSCLLINYHGVR